MGPPLRRLVPQPGSARRGGRWLRSRVLATLVQVDVDDLLCGGSLSLATGSLQVSTRLHGCRAQMEVRERVRGVET